MQATARRQSGMQTGHLLAWVVGCAVGFTAYRSITPAPIPTIRGVAIVTGYNLAMGTAVGTILTGCGLMAYRRHRGDTTYPSLPGHWLLLFGLAAGAVDVAAAVAYHSAVVDPSYPVTPYLAQFQPGGASSRPTFYHQMVGWIVGALAALGFFWAVRRRLPRRWIAVFFTFALVAAILGGGHIVVLLLAPRMADDPPLNRLFVRAYAGAVVLGAVATVSAADKDRRSGAPTDGPHRLGVGAWLAIAATQLAMYGVYLIG
jgi:hypothetical protein